MEFEDGGDDYFCRIGSATGDGIRPIRSEKALMVISIAAGSTILSHVNDSGFWLVNKYLGMTENQTLRSWAVMETIISLTGFLIVLELYYIVV